jgi:conjugative transfer pilus assembly protein TraH
MERLISQKQGANIMFARIALFLLIVFLVNTVHASWVDDWVDQRTSSGGDYFESQKRGFGTFGSASMRWKVGNDHLLTVSKPQFKAGCGGIDAFLGGFSFLQFEQLVDKFEKVMGPAAAAFAFDIALSVLSEQASESIKSLTAIIDRLNQLQIEDCMAAKGITATIADGITLEKYAADKSEAVKDFLQTSGIEDLYNSINEMGRSKTVSAVMSDSGAGSNSQMIAGCSSELRSIFFTDGFILDHLGG